MIEIWHQCWGKNEHNLEIHVLGCHTKRNNQQTSLSQGVVCLNSVHISPEIIIMLPARPGQPSAPCRWQDGRRDIFGSVGQRHTLIIGYSWEWNRGGHKFDPLSILMQPRDARDKFFPSIYHIRTYATQHAEETTCSLPSGCRHVSLWSTQIEITKMISMLRKY
jgi:hypothetical protein